MPALLVPDLRSRFTGQVIGPDDPGYDDARTVFPGGIDRRPAVIIRPVDAKDVARVVELARETGLELAVRSGGHSPVGHGVSEGGIVLDLRDLRALDIDVEGRTAWAEAGLTAADYTTATGAHGLATGFGDTGSVGIGGITLGGGVGFLVRKYGLTIDSLLAADVVLASGELVRASADENPDLFWAIRGGGGNFGVVTRFQYRLHEVPTIVGGMLLLPASAEIVSAFLAEAAAAPEELSTIANVMPAPPMPFVPADQHGKLSLMALVCYAGPADDGERALAPFRALAKPIVDMVQAGPYSSMFPPEEDGYHPTAAVRTMYLDHVGLAEASTVMEHLSAGTAFMNVAQLRVLGGASARVPSDATAYAHRGSRIMANVAAMYGDPTSRPVHEDWVARLSAALNQGDDSGYVGFVGDEGPAGVGRAYPGATGDRLAEIKRSYDPTNLFRLNQNIAPAPALAT